MRIYPKCEIKLLNDCEPGQFVRAMGHRANGEFAIIAGVPDIDARALILFQEGGPRVFGRQCR